MIVLGFTGAAETLGVSSFCRFWLTDIHGYYAFLHFFRSSAWDLSRLMEHWFVFALSRNQAITSQGRLATFGDHTYVSKEGRRMPGVVALRQHSETQSEPSYFRGQCWGAPALAVGRLAAPFALPLKLEMHQGVGRLSNSKEENSPSLAESMVRMAIDFALTVNRPAPLVLDAFFSVGPVVLMARSVRSASTGPPLVEIIVRAKRNYAAYPPPETPASPKVGRPAIYGQRINIMEVFDHARLFRKVSCRIYGKTEEVLAPSLDLARKPVKGLIRFVFVQSSHGRMVLMFGDLEQAPIAAVELYCLRTRIETMFQMLKQLLSVFNFHFRSKKTPRNSRTPERNKNLRSPAEENIETVEACYRAAERFVNLGALALGFLQLISLKFSSEIWRSSQCFSRTRSRSLPSERTVMRVMSGSIVHDFLNLAPSATMAEIRHAILRGEIERKLAEDAKFLQSKAS